MATGDQKTFVNLQRLKISDAQSRMGTSQRKQATGNLKRRVCDSVLRVDR